MHLKNDYNSLSDLAIHMNSRALSFLLELLGDRPRHADFYKKFFDNLVMEERYLDNPDNVKLCIKFCSGLDVKVIFN